MKRILSILLSACLFVGLSAQDYTQVHILGGATPNGWANDKAQTMTLVSSDEESAVFTWTGPLKASDFKFINKLGTWQPCFNAPTKDEPVEPGKAHTLVYNYDAPDAVDHKFVMAEAGFYTVTVDLKKLTMTVSEAELSLPEELWVTGTAIPGGTAKLANAPGGLARFIYIGELLEGDFKVMTSATADEFTQYIVPLEEDVDVTGETQLVITDDSSLPGWSVIVSDPAYKVCIDLVGKKSEGSIHYSRESLYMVGGAVATGWRVEDALPFTRDEQNPDLFVFDGELKVHPENTESNLFKIVGQLDWGPYSLHPYTENEPLLESKHVRINGADTKWAIDTDKQGRYIIEVNTLHETIEARFVGDESAVKEVSDNESLFHVHNTSDGLHIRMAEGHQADCAQLIGMDGGLIHSIRQAGSDFTLGGNAAPGIYLLKIDCGKKSFVQRVIVK